LEGLFLAKIKFMDLKEMAKKNVLVIGRVLLFCLISAMSLAVASGMTKGLPLYESNILTVGIAFVCTIFITFLFVRWEHVKLQQIGILPGKESARRLLTGLLAGSVLASLQPMFVLMLGHVTLYRSSSVNAVGVITSLVLYLLVALREEVAFRGYPLRVLDDKLGSLRAQIIVAVLFIIEHKIGGMNWFQAIAGPGMGAVFFGMAALKTRGLALPIGLHTAWNFVQWFLGFKPEQGVFQIRVEKGFETRVELGGWLSYVAVMMLGICILMFWKSLCNRLTIAKA
jgi:membrane protease YdiL (CAAX protease family)